MSNFGSLFKFHEIAIDQFFENKKPSCESPLRWWMKTIIIGHFAGLATITFKQLQVHAVIISMEHALVSSMNAFYLTAVNGEGPSLKAEINKLDDQQ